MTRGPANVRIAADSIAGHTMHVFTYGSLMYGPVWQRLVTGPHRAVTGTITGFERRRIVGAAYPALMRGSGVVQGIVYCDLDATELATLDRFELEGEDYRRIAVPVALADGTTLHAWTYLYLKAERIAPEPWDPARFERHDLPRFIETYCRAHAPRQAEPDAT